MKILFVCENFNTRSNGTSTSAARFARFLIDQGHEVRVISDAVDEDDIKVYTLKERYMPIVTEVSKTQGYTFAKPNRKVVKEALDWADAVHAVTPWKISHVIRRLCQKRQIPFTGAFHIDPENITYGAGLGRLGWPLVRPIYAKFRRYFNKVGTVHCPSYMIANELKTYRYKSQMKVISNGVSDEFFSDLPKQDSPYIKILSVGRYAKEKQQSLIIKAIAKLKNKDDILLTLAGKGPRKGRLMRLAKRLNVRTEFKFFNKAELIQEYRNSDYYIHAAVIEVEGMSALEAIAAGVLPIISDARKSATKQFAINNDHLFKARSVDSLVGRLNFWLKAPLAYREEAKKQYAEFIQRYKIEHSAIMFEEMINEAVINTKNKKLYEEERKTSPYIKKLLPNRFLRIFSFLLYYLIAVPILYLLLKIVFRTRIYGQENLKLFKGGAVVVSNHVHILDSPMNTLAVFPKKPVFTSIPQNFTMPVAGFFVKTLGAVPIPANIPESRNFFYVMSMLAKRGRYIHVFPEGDLSPRATILSKFKRGPFKIAVDTSVPIVPIGIRFTTRRTYFGRQVRVTQIHIGKPILPDFGLPSKQAIDTLLNQTYESMTKLISL